MLAFPLPTGPLLSFMSCVFAMPFLVMNNGSLQFICRQERRTTSRIFALLAVDFGSALQVSKQKVSRTKLAKVFSLAMSYTPHKILFGMTSSFKDVKLQFIMSSIKDSMMFLSSHSTQMFSIYFVLPMVMILLKSKVLLMPLPN